MSGLIGYLWQYIICPVQLFEDGEGAQNLETFPENIEGSQSVLSTNFHSQDILGIFQMYDNHMFEIRTTRYVISIIYKRTAFFIIVMFITKFRPVSFRFRVSFRELWTEHFIWSTGIDRALSDKCEYVYIFQFLFSTAQLFLALFPLSPSMHCPVHGLNSQLIRHQIRALTL